MKPPPHAGCAIPVSRKQPSSSFTPTAIPAGTHPLQVKDDEQTRWFPADEIPPFSVDHFEIMQYGLRRLRTMLE